MAIIQSMGADVFGINCSNGPEEILRLIQPLKNHTKTPLLSKPNAGMPETDARGNAVYKMTGSALHRMCRLLLMRVSGFLAAAAGQT